jgi:hypothetical protein
MFCKNRQITYKIQKKKGKPSMYLQSTKSCDPVRPKDFVFIIYVIKCNTIKSLHERLN